MINGTDGYILYTEKNLTNTGNEIHTSIRKNFPKMGESVVQNWLKKIDESNKLFSKNNLYDYVENIKKYLVIELNNLEITIQPFL